MRIILLVSLFILVISFFVNKAFYSAKRNLFKGQEAWSGKDLKIKYNKSKEISVSKSNDNYLKMIADESKVFLEDQSNQDAE